jgi:hypothetical protein
MAMHAVVNAILALFIKYLQKGNISGFVTSIKCLKVISLGMIWGGYATDASDVLKAVVSII